MSVLNIYSQTQLPRRYSKFNIHLIYRVRLLTKMLLYFYYSNNKAVLYLKCKNTSVSDEGLRHDEGGQDKVNGLHVVVVGPVASARG